MKPNALKLKLLFSILLFSFNRDFLISQNWYSGLDAGYGFGLASQNITSNINIGPTQTSNTVVKGSFGQGFNLNLYLGYKLKNHISCEVGFSYLEGNKFKGIYSKDTVFKQDLTIGGKMFRITPALKITSGEQDSKTRFYLKMGIVARLAGKITVESMYSDVQSNTISITETKYSKGLSLGATSSIGVINKLNDRTSLFAEVFFISQSWAPKNGDIVKYSINGIDQTELLNSGQKHFHFSNSYTSTTNSQSAYIPYKQLKQYYSFSSIGLKVGLQFILGKKK